ncbi:MAG: outer membrane beta-barrel protein [Bacteroidales bacterium]|nr:outer membrane beta-barrel protein [Bacteroidales bacterium]
MNTMNTDKIKKLAGSLLSQFEAEPPLDMWNRIELQIRKRKRRALLWYIATAASVIILLGVGFSLLTTDKGTVVRSDRSQVAVSEEGSDLTGNKGVASEKQLKSVIPPVNSEVRNEKNPSDFNSENQASGIDQNIELSAVESTPVSEISIVNQQDILISEIITPKVNANDAHPDSIELVEVRTTQVVSDDKISPDILQPNVLQPPVTDEPGKGNWQLAMGYGTSSAAEMTNGESALKSQSGNFSYDGLTAEVANETSYFEEIENISHDAPLSLGFLISRQFGQRWFAETGLLYTRLGYMVKTYEMNNIYQQYSNELYYLGIPLGVRFAVLERKHFGIFATQSVIIEKGITSRGNTDTYTQGVLSGSENKETAIRGVQLSSLTGIGADVRISGNLAAYGQAGVQLFFLNSTQPYNIRSARMAWPSFQIGVRMNLDK